MVQRVALLSRRQNVNHAMARQHDDEWHDDYGFTRASQRDFFTHRTHAAMMFHARSRSRRATFFHDTVPSTPGLAVAIV